MNNAQNIVLIPAYEPGPPLIRLLYDLSDHGNLIVVTEILFFTFSWFIQRSFVFRGRKGAVIVNFFYN